MKRLIVPIIAAIAFAYGCSGSISGTIFVDKNGNNILDPGESGKTKTAYEYTLSKNGEVIVSNRTDLNGFYKIKYNGGSGKFCTSIKRTSLTFEDVGKSKSISKGVTAGSVAEGGTCSVTADCMTGLSLKCLDTICKKVTAGTVDENESCDADVDCESGLECISGKCKKESTPATPPIVTSPVPFETCVTTNGTSQRLNLNVPISVDINATIHDQIPDILKEDILGGSEFTLEVYYPSSCKLLPLKLPAGVELPNSSLASLDLSKALPDESKEILSFDLAIDNVNMVSQKLIAPPPKTDDYTITFNPQVICPNDSIKPLKTISFNVTTTATTKLKSVKKVDISINTEEVASSNWIFPPQPSYTKLTISIKNNDNLDYEEISLYVTLPSGSSVVPIGTNDKCDTAITSIKCKISKLEINEEESFEFGYKLPSIDGTYEGTISTTLEFPDGSIIEPEDITFSVYPDTN